MTFGLMCLSVLLATGERTSAQSQTEHLDRAAVESDWLQQFSLRRAPAGARIDSAEIERILQRSKSHVDRLQQSDIDVTRLRDQLEREQADRPANDGAVQDRYLRTRWFARDLTLADPELDFESLVFVLRAPGSFACMSDQYYGWFSRPGGGLYVLDGWKQTDRTLRLLSSALPEGSVLRPDLSYDATRVLFAYARYYPGLDKMPDKLDKERLPEDSFYHLYEVRLDGTNLRRLTTGKYEHFDGRYLPDGRIVLVSTRRGCAVQCNVVGSDSGAADSYMRCGGNAERPVPVCTLHVMDGDGQNLRCLSPGEGFEWNPTVADDGRIVYSRWDYVDRESLPFVSLWSTWPDGSAAQSLFGNFTLNPIGMFEPRQIPGSRDFLFTASAQHFITGGSLVRLDPRLGQDVPDAMTRITPEVAYPESEGWPLHYFAAPFPISPDYTLVAWSNQPLVSQFERHAGQTNPTNAFGLYLLNRCGDLELIHRDNKLSSTDAIPARVRKRPPQLSSISSETRGAEGRMLLLDVTRGLENLPAGAVRRLRIVGITPKTQPVMNFPSLGMTDEDAGKFVLGTVPVEADGSAFFRVPSDVPVFFQALDERGMAIQTMRSVTYVPDGRTYTCIGCHEQRTSAPPNRAATAATRPPDRILPGPPGSWPLDYEELVQPVLDQHCVSCHKPGADGSKFDLSPGSSYSTLIAFGSRGTLQSTVMKRYTAGYSVAGSEGASTSPLVRFLRRDHYNVHLKAEDWDRLSTWMDLYAQRAGSFSAAQSRELQSLKKAWSSILAEQ